MSINTEKIKRYQLTEHVTNNGHITYFVHKIYSENGVFNLGLKRDKPSTFMKYVYSSIIWTISGEKPIQK